MNYAQVGALYYYFLLLAYVHWFLKFKAAMYSAHVQVNPKEMLGKSLLFNVLKVPHT